jgi:tetratricopeptide (TPR) repeat protein
MDRRKFHFELFEALIVCCVIVSFVLAVSGCASVQGQIEAGRRDLLYGDPNLATAYFERAAETAPERLYFSVLPEGSLTYLGRAYYATGKLPEARQALERAVSRYERDNLAKLYLGLVRVRQGDRERGLREVESGLRGIHDWIEYVEHHFAFSFGRFWDPGRPIRKQIEADLAMISSGKVDGSKLIADAEWVGRQMEEEIDRARRDETDEKFRDGEGRDGRGR